MHRGSSVDLKTVLVDLKQLEILTRRNYVNQSSALVFRYCVIELLVESHGQIVGGEPPGEPDEQLEAHLRGTLQKRKDFLDKEEAGKSQNIFCQV